MTIPIRKISIAKDFSKVPAGRYAEDGPKSGQIFREQFLAPALESGDSVLVDLDGTEGYGSSFLEEAFGGLIRKQRFGRADLLSRLNFTSAADPSLLVEINQYLDEATAEDSAASDSKKSRS